MVDIDKHEICERMRRIATGLGLTYTEIASRSGLNPSTIWQIFHGKTLSPKFSTVVRIVEAMDQGELPIVEQINIPRKRKS